MNKDRDPKYIRIAMIVGAAIFIAMAYLIIKFGMWIYHLIF